MAKDGLLFPIFGQLTEKTQVPLYGTVISGVASGLIAFFLDINTLADMISMGTLLAFSTVCSGICILRLQPPVQRPNAIFHALVAFVFVIGVLSFSIRLEWPLAVSVRSACTTALTQALLPYVKL